MFDDKSIDKDNPPEKRDRRRKTECIVRSDKLIYRKAYSETQLLDAVGFDFKEGESYHCITAGDVDSLSYLKCVLRQQDLDYCIFSTWCMAADDIMQFEEWLEDGKIKKLDAYVGEVCNRGVFCTKGCEHVQNFVIDSPCCALGGIDGGDTYALKIQIFG